MGSSNSKRHDEAVATSKHEEVPDWELYGGRELEPYLANTDLIDAAWLLDLVNGKVMPERNGVVPPWQLVPAEAKVSLDKLRRSKMFRLPVGVLSYGWAAKHHPDPTGALLLRLKPVLEAMVDSCKHGISRFNAWSKPVAWGILWDFMSFPQRGYTTKYDPDVDDRTPYEQARFNAGLEGINAWYGAPYTTTLVCDWPMPPGAENPASLEARGWCRFERSLSSVRKDGDCCLALSQLPPGGAELDWQDVQMNCRLGRLPPLRPDDFEMALRSGMTSGAVRFTNRKDATDICIPQYREGFLRLMGAGWDMRFRGCKWTDADVHQLAAALKYAHEAGATTQVRKLDLSDNELTAAALPPLLEAISAGAMPRLDYLRLSLNELGDEGIAELAAALSEGRLPTLAELWLDCTGMGDAGAAALARSLGGAPALKQLRASGGALGEAVRAQLYAACAQNGVEAYL